MVVAVVGSIYFQLSHFGFDVCGLGGAIRMAWGEESPPCTAVNAVQKKEMEQFPSCK